MKKNYFKKIKFADEYINKSLMKINKDLAFYVEKNILPEYKLTFRRYS